MIRPRLARERCSDKLIPSNRRGDVKVNSGVNRWLRFDGKLLMFYSLVSQKSWFLSGMWSLFGFLNFTFILEFTWILKLSWIFKSTLIFAFSWILELTWIFELTWIISLYFLVFFRTVLDSNKPNIVYITIWFELPISEVPTLILIN